jgi:predicted O-methyltransferase YrrM
MTGSIYEALSMPEELRYVSVSKEQGEYIFNFLREENIKKTLEIGFAYGGSAAHIMSATRSEHYVIEPFPEYWDNLGLRNIERLGLESLLRLQKGFSHDILPRLVGEGIKFDFVFIDGDHRYDSIFIDFFYSDLLLNQKGYVLFHDIWMRSTQMVCSWIDTNKANYKMIPTPVNNIVLYRKNGTDNRNWDHFRDFYSVADIPGIRFFKTLFRRVLRGCMRGNNQ